MDKEKILELSRKENENRDPYELEVQNRAGNIAGLCMTLVMLILFVSKFIFRGEYDFGIFSLTAVMTAARYVCYGVKFKRKDQLICGIVWCVIFAGSFLAAMYKIIRG